MVQDASEYAVKHDVYNKAELQRRLYGVRKRPLQLHAHLVIQA